MSLSNLTAAQLNKAANIQEKIDKLTAELSAILGQSATSAPAVRGRGRPKGAGKKAESPVVPAEKPRKKRKMSAAGKAAIAAAQKARWAKVKAEKAG